MIRLKPLTVVACFERHPRAAHLQFDFRARALGVTNQVVDCFLEHQEDLSADVGSQFQIMSCGWSVECELDIARREHFAGYSSHPAHDVGQMTLLWFYCPDNISHRI